MRNPFLVAEAPKESGAGDLAFLGGGGEMGELMRGFDWASSKLGPPENWTATLRATVALMLNSRFPMFVAWGPDLVTLYNDSYATILADKHPRALGSGFDDVWREIWSDLLPFVEDAFRGDATWMENLPLTMNRNGYFEETFFTFSYSPIPDDGRIVGMFCACTETTPQVVAERALRERESSLADSLASRAEALAAREGLLADKDMLLAEVNHRVKNSLQLVVSTLALQSRRLQDPTTKAAFEQAITRVRAISSVHERLYKDHNPLVVGMRSYLRGLADDLADSSELRDRMQVDVDDVELRTERAIPIALIVNELVTNALKYAYPPGRPGPVMLMLKMMEGGRIVLSVSDEGTGMSSTTTTGGLGTRLIDTMASQLDGEIERQVTEHGYRVTVTFPQELA